MNRSLLALGGLGAAALFTLASCTESREPLGPPVTQSTPKPLIVPAPGPISQISSHGVGLHNCAVQTDGVVACWGRDNVGQAPASRSPTVGRFTQVGAGLYSTCAVRTDGVVECWGANIAGDAPPTKSPANASPFIQVTGGGYDTACAVRADGVIECWGDNNNGQAPPTKTSANGSPFMQVSATTFSGCAVRADGVIECWGLNTNGEAPRTKTSANGSPFTQVSMGASHTCAVRADGVVECWGGDNINGQAPPIKPSANGSPFMQVSAGTIHTCAVRADGVIECWGIVTLAPATKSSANGSAFTQVTAGTLHSCGLRSDNYVECWGGNGEGQGPELFPLIPPTHVLPTASFSATPASVYAGQSFSLTLANAQVPGHPEATQFTYAFDCGDGNGYSVFGSASSTTCATSATGTRTVKGKVRDESLDETEYTGSIDVLTPPDNTAPVITPNVTGDLGAHGWYTSAVSVTWTVTDDESDVTSRPCGLTVITADTPRREVTCGATSAGGTAVKSVIIKLDATSPTITFASVTPAPNAAGWNTTSVAVNWTCTDATSGVVSATETQPVTSEGQNRNALGRCVDDAGNVATNRRDGINIDKTAPTLAPTVSQSPVAMNGVLTALPNGSDVLSGIATESCMAPNTSSVGTKTLDCTATDRAGNVATKSVSYAVAYQFSGFTGPIDGNGVLNVAKAGQSVPLKWRLLDAAGVPMTYLTTATVTVASLACALGASADDVEEYTAGASGLQNLGNGYYQFNWKTSKDYAGSCKTLQLDLGEGITRNALFQFTK